MKEKIEFFVINVEGIFIVGEIVGVGKYESYGKWIFGERFFIEFGIVRKLEINFLKVFGEKLIGFKI